MYKIFFKRIIDFVISVFFLVCFSPAIILIGLLIKFDSEGPIFFRPARGGLKGKSFFMYKFRTMYLGSEFGATTTAFNDSRITRIGSFLRKTKLDETPQFFNVALGQMSIVGPRPELICYTEQYCDETIRILDVKPGITDLSSIKFHDLSFLVGENDPVENYEKYILRRKNKLRLFYATKCCFRLDLLIFCKSAKILFNKLASHHVK